MVKTPPFRIQEEGWGEFDMQIGLTAADKEHFVTHDLNFAQNRYESKHLIVSTRTSSDQSVVQCSHPVTVDIQKPQASSSGGPSRVGTCAR